MTDSASLADDEAQLAAYSAVLGDQVRADLPGWVESSVARRADRDLTSSAREAGGRAADEIGRRMDLLLATDIDSQTTTPLALLRAAVRYPTEVLAAAGTPPQPRDEFAQRNFPDDLYDLTPAKFGDISPAVHDAGLRWGAAKAHVHLRRRRDRR